MSTTAIISGAHASSGSSNTAAASAGPDYNSGPEALAMGTAGKAAPDLMSADKRNEPVIVSSGGRQVKVIKYAAVFLLVAGIISLVVAAPVCAINGCPSKSSNQQQASQPVVAAVVYAIPASCSTLSSPSTVSALLTATIAGLAATANVPTSYIALGSTTNTCTGRKRHLLSSSLDDESMHGSRSPLGVHRLLVSRWSGRCSGMKAFQREEMHVYVP